MQIATLLLQLVGLIFLKGDTLKKLTLITNRITMNQDRFLVCVEKDNILLVTLFHLLFGMDYVIFL